MRSPLLAVAFSLLLPVTPAHAAPDCNRSCLRAFVTQYLLAMVAHNPGLLRLSDNVRFTENTEEKKLGEGLWKDASKIGAYRQDILDTRDGVAASQVVIEANGMAALLGLRLKIENKKIAEIETLVTRSKAEGALFAIDSLHEAGPVFSKPPEKSQLMSREDAVKAAEFYPAGLKVGSFVKVDAPFAPDAYRIENGVRTAGQGCARAGCEDIKTQKIISHPGLSYQVMAVDEQLGIVLLWMNFGQTGSYGPGNSLVVWEAFKVYAGQIHGVEAFMKVMPETTKRGWE